MFHQQQHQLRRMHPNPPPHLPTRDNLLPRRLMRIGGGECDPTEVPTPTPIDPPTPVETPELPKAGFTSQMELINGEPWIVMVNEQTTVWAAHNQEGWPAASWWQLFVGVEFYWEYGDNPGWYRVTNYILAEPTDVHLIYTTEPDLILLTCRGYDPATNQWAQRLVLYAEVSP